MNFIRRLLLVLFLLFFLSVQNVYAEQAIVINEFMANPSDGIEWVEFYHPTNSDLIGYSLDDDMIFADDGGNQKIIVVDTVVTVGSYSYFDITKYKYFFNNDEDFVVLFDQSGEIVDSYKYELNGEDKGVSIGRFPDGSGQFEKLATITKGNANGSVLPTVTPTLANTPTPSSTPKPTKTPTPTKKITGTPPTSYSQSNESPYSDGDNTNAFSVFADEEGSRGARPTAILGASASAKRKSASQSAKVKGLAEKKDSQEKNHIGFFAFGGAFILLACGILIFVKKRKTT